MENLKNNTEKLCSFYVSEWHLATMILPYISKKIDEKANIITILENNIESNITTLISKLNLKNEDKILKIDWKNYQGIKYSEVIKKFNNLNSDNNIIFINGNKHYIDAVNRNIEKLINKTASKFKNMKFKIVNCYEVTEFNDSIKEILDTHSKVLNTAGEKYISEVFEGYQRKMA